MSHLSDIQAAVALGIETYFTKQKATQTVTLDYAVAELLKAKIAANCRPKYLKNLRWYVGKFAEGRGAAPVNTFGECEIKAWFEMRNEKPASKKFHIRLLSVLFSFCWRRRWIAENPIKRLDPVRLDRTPPAVLTLDQCEKAMRWCEQSEPKLLAWLALAMFAGLRPEAECDCITWSAIDLERGRITVTISKVRAHRILDMDFSPPLKPWLDRAKALNSPLNQRLWQRRECVARLRKHLNLSRWPQDVLRHTACSNLLAFHQDAGKVASFMGHSAGTLLRHYKSLVVKEDARGWCKIAPRPK